MSRVHGTDAQIIEKRAYGRTLSIGGLWPGATHAFAPAELIIVDLSEAMLSMWSHFDARFINADARCLPFKDGSIDTVVFPMMLHHVCDGTARGARKGVRDVFAE